MNYDAGTLKILNDTSISHVDAAAMLSTSEASVRRARAKLEVVPETSNKSKEEANKGKITITPEGADVEDVVVPKPISTDWTEVFALFNLDANEFEVVDNTVRMSTWQQSKATEDGERDIIQLYSYNAKFRRKTQDRIDAQEYFDDLKKSLLKSIQLKPESSAKRLKTWATLMEVPTTYTLLVADPQLGKKGTSEAVENWERGVTKHLNEVEKLLESGANVSSIHVAYMGDETENVVNSYENQPWVTELNRSEQLELDTYMRVWTQKQAAAYDLQQSASSVISNHGLWTRNGGKDPVTSHNDNASTHIARQVKYMFEQMEEFGGPSIDWTIGSDRPSVLVELSGVDCYFSHGYIEKGRGASTELRVKNAIENQILGRPLELGGIPLFFMAHYHHYFQWEDRGRAIFGCPALEADGASEWMLDNYGVWSPSGMLGMLVGKHTSRSWSHLNIF